MADKPKHGSEVPSVNSPSPAKLPGGHDDRRSGKASLGVTRTGQNIYDEGLQHGGGMDVSPTIQADKSPFGDKGPPLQASRERTSEGEGGRLLDQNRPMDDTEGSPFDKTK